VRFQTPTWWPVVPLFVAVGAFLACVLIVFGARWIQEHYMVHPSQETYSYYGPINRLCLNMGYHNEHHDLPSIPWNNLPKLKAMAPEFYDNLKFHSSWTRLLFQFIFDKRYTLFSRIERTRERAASRTIVAVSPSNADTLYSEPEVVKV